MRHLTSMLLGSTPLWAPEGVGTGTGDGTGTGTGTGGDGAWKAPEGMPAEFAGKDAAETVGKLWQGYGALSTRSEGLRTQLAQQPKAPEKPELYNFKPNEKLAPFFGDVANNPALKHARAAFHKAGVPDTAFQQIIDETYGPMIEAGMIQPPYNPQTEIQSYMSANGADKMTTEAHFREAEGFAKGLAGQLNQKVPEALRKDVEAQLVALTDTAAGNTLLMVLKGRLAESGFRVPDESSGTYQGELTDADIDQLTADPRIDPRNQNHADQAKRFDKALRDRYDAGMAARGQRKYAGKA